VSDSPADIYRRLLILRCQTGDEAALSELIALHSPGLRVFISKLLVNSSAVDDVLQDTWFDVFRKINRLQSPDSFVAWLYRIARDKVFRFLRRKISVPVDESVIGDLPADVDEFFADEAEQVRLALDELSIEHREVLVLRFVEDMTYEQIAEVTGEPIGTVRSRLYYAKQALRNRLTSTQKETRS